MIRTATPFLLALWAGGAMAEGPALPGLPFDLGGDFSLTDQWGDARTQADPDGKLQLVFFGYANCDAICTMALPQMGLIQETLLARGTDVSIVMVTIDGARDTVESMADPLADIHPNLIGLTGSEAELQTVYDLFQIDLEHLFDDPEYGAIYAHTSNYYLLDGDGAFLTVLPPILGPERYADILEGYAGAS